MTFANSVPDLLTVKEVAALLRVKASWVYVQVERDDCCIPFTRVGRYLRFDRNAILAYLDSQSGGVGA